VLRANQASAEALGETQPIPTLHINNAIAILTNLRSPAVTALVRRSWSRSPYFERQGGGTLKIPGVLFVRLEHFSLFVLPLFPDLLNLGAFAQETAGRSCLVNPQQPSVDAIFYLCRRAL